MSINDNNKTALARHTYPYTHSCTWVKRLNGTHRYKHSLTSTHSYKKNLTHGETLAQEQTTALVSSSSEVARFENFILPAAKKGKYKSKAKEKC